MASIDDFHIVHNDFTQKWEGSEKFTHDPDDPGGATKYGISFRFLKNLPLKTADINKDGKKTWQDIAKLDAKKAEYIFFDYFWKPLQANSMPTYLAMVAYDSAVNVGIVRVIKWLQDILDIPSDGVIGPQTIKAIQEADENFMIEKLLKRRATYYLTLEKDTEWADKFIKGWLNRTSALAKFVGMPEIFDCFLRKL